ncbi:MAG: family 43 glycosylhydrolase [Clostridia bacterium]|nr:family 43 glycosylhydrolase [Clostridia bacterium]
MKLNFGSLKRSQPDPFIFEDKGRYYLYVTACDGVEAYSADSPFDLWHFEGVVCSIGTHKHYWAPSIIRQDDWYYIYVSCQDEGMFQYLHAARAKSPLGPFTDAKCLFDRFSIDSHVVKTEAGLFLWYAEDNTDTDRIGTRVFVDRLMDPYTPACTPREVIVPTMDEEIFMRNRNGDGRDWHTIEGAFWFREGDWQYVMYSGACFQNDTYHIGYAAAKTGEPDLTRVDFVKHTADGRFDPVMMGNEYEEGVGHHSVLQYKGHYYAVYHARDIDPDPELQGDRRTARICRLHVRDGIITAERYPDRV